MQTGIGRTGAWFAFQPFGIQHDVHTLAKGLGGGLPIGAMVAFGEAADLLTPGSHGSTFGGNPVSARAALTVLDVIEREELLARAEKSGALLKAELARASAGCVGAVRGRGLLLAAELDGVSSADVDVALRAGGILANPVAPQAIRLAPALNITDADLSDTVMRWGDAFQRLGARAS